MMKEFGSDFHRCDMDFRNTINNGSNVSLLDVYRDVRLYACGRQSIEAIVKYCDWNRLWMPAYFCYEVIEHIVKSTGIEVVFYDDTPLVDNEIVNSLPYKDGDALLRVNYFGLRSKRDNNDIPVHVIEDHTHSLVSDWALKSDADYCVSSIRKTMPIAAGGILWSPKGKDLPKQIATTSECETMAGVRYEGMQLKTNYLQDSDNDIILKKNFREKYLHSEEMIKNLRISGIDNVSFEIVKEMNIKMWNEIRLNNWLYAYERLKDKFNILKPDIIHNDDNVFSLVILCHNVMEQMKLRTYLIKNNVYPAILWKIPEETMFKNALNVSRRIISVQIDARYNMIDIDKLCSIIRNFYA